MNLEMLKAVEKKLAKDPRFAGIVVQMKQLRTQSEAAKDQKQFYADMVALMEKALEKTAEATAATSPGDLMVKNVDTAALMVEVMKDFVHSVADKELEQSMVDQLKALTTGLDSLQKNMERIAAKEVPTPQVNVVEKVVELVVPEPKVIDNTKVIQETAEAKKQTSLLEKLLSSKLIKSASSFISNLLPGDAIAVRLVSKDGKEFIDPRTIGGGGAMIAGGGGQGPATVTPATAGVATEAVEGTVAASTSSQVAIASNPDRNYGIISNQSDGLFYISMSGEATTSSPDYLFPGDTWYLPVMKDGKVYTGDISIIWKSTSTGNAVTSEI